jgi:hypothetical protein
MGITEVLSVEAGAEQQDQQKAGNSMSFHSANVLRYTLLEY